MKLLKILLLIGSAAAALAALFVYSGVFDVAADVPHSALVYGLMETVRDRSIAVRAKSIEVPALDDPQLIAGGGRDYAEMCISCHREPGGKESELRQGLYPKPPDLTQRIEASSAEMFWVIKHGIKMSAMPAWGRPTTISASGAWWHSYISSPNSRPGSTSCWSTRTANPITLRTGTTMTALSMALT